MVKTPVMEDEKGKPLILINGGRRGYLVGMEPQACLRLLHAKPVNCALAE